MQENRLIHETSPYLLQHAYNPVDWYPWGDEAIEKAKKEDRPILVSIGYAACHWCHVMEKESFEDPATAAIMNQYFVNIKVDREERPDVDHIYMDALQAMTGSGGWPLNVFLTPDLKPFYGGTYFPPVRAYNRMSWKETLLAVQHAFEQKRDEIESQAGNLTEHIAHANTFISKNEEEFTESDQITITENILKQADTEWGGFGQAPKFPHTFLIQYLLKEYYHTGNKKALEQATLSLDKLIQGGIYDHLAGGFARYSTDEKWLAPHFEKMLYDNALIIEALAEAYQVTQKPLYRTAIEQTIEFIRSDMMSRENGFYSAYDADSEGVEGKYYTWSKTEIDQLLGDDASIFSAVYDVTEEGNWEGTNILWQPVDLHDIAVSVGMDDKELEEVLQRFRSVLLQERRKRVPPLLDDKQLLSWNALMNTALSKAYAALGDETFRLMAISNMQFIEKAFYLQNGWKHTYKNGTSKINAFLDDMAFLIRAYVQLQEVTGDQSYLVKANDLMEQVCERFSDEEGLMFYFTEKGNEQVIVRKKEVYDGALPSSNAVIADMLMYLGRCFDKKTWEERSRRMVFSLKKAVVSYPTSFGYWCCVQKNAFHGLDEIAIIGEDVERELKEYLAFYHPGHILQAARETNDQRFPLLFGKPVADRTLIYLCKGYSCQEPVTSINELRPLIKKLN